MRNEFAQAVIDADEKYRDLVFITGDLGYMALEKLQQKFGERFINSGVAEQNMITIAASLAYEGFVPFVYSISPFITLRPYEQIRNDVCLHNLPVKIIANGGGYGYGIMGATHHNIEDIGSMRMMPNMKIYVPFLATDVVTAVNEMIVDKRPNYLRLNVGAKIKYDVAPFAQWRKIKNGNKGVVIGTGPVVENICNSDFATDLEIWVVSILPITDLPPDLVNSINSTRKVIVIEEHNGECGLRETISYHVMNQLTATIKILSLSANGYPSGKYGDQKWHQNENGLGGPLMEQKLGSFISSK